MTTKYDEALRATITNRHQATAGKVMPLPDPAGAFPSTLLPWVWPFVLDTHALGNDLVRCARSGRTILVSGAISGVLRLYCPRHVVGEVHKWMSLWAQRAGRPVDEMAQLWVREYLPVLRVVDVPQDLLYPDEAALVRILATVGHPHGDPDDVPTAHLALLLDAPALSKDKNLLRAIYGGDHDFDAHGEWLDTLRAGGNTGPLGEFLLAGYFLTAVPAVGIYSLIAKSVDVLGWPLTIALFGLGALGVRHFASAETKAKVANGLKKAALEGWELLQTVMVSYGEALAQIESMSPKSPPHREGYDPSRVLRRASIHKVGRIGSGHISAEQLSEQLYLPGVPHGEAKVRAMLRSESAFAQVYQGRFQLGHALVRRRSSDQAESPLPTLKSPSGHGCVPEPRPLPETHGAPDDIWDFRNEGRK